MELFASTTERLNPCATVTATDEIPTAADAREAFRASASAGGKRRFGFASGSCWMTESSAEFGQDQTFAKAPKCLMLSFHHRLVLAP